MDNIETLLNSLMPALRILAGQSNADTEGALTAEVQIDDCLSKLSEAEKQSFLKHLGDRAAAEMAVAPSATARSFWRTVAEYAASPKHSS